MEPIAVTCHQRGLSAGWCIHVCILTMLLVGACLPIAAGAQTGEPATRPATLPARQIHLDFHTSQWLKDIGVRFNKQQWQSALRLGRVISINIFAKCHHSWSYYPTQVGRMHPNLKFDLLGQQIEACHEIGIRCPIYFTVGWSANDAEDHPETPASWPIFASLTSIGPTPATHPTRTRPTGSRLRRIPVPYRRDEWSSCRIVWASCTTTTARVCIESTSATR